MAGDQFISVYGNLNMSSTDSSDTTTTIFGGSFGKFISDEKEVTGSLSLFDIYYDNGGSTMYTLSGKFNYNFIKPGLTNIPYAGCALGITGVDAGGYSDTSISFGVQGGFKNFISEDISFNVEGSLMHYEVESKGTNSLSITAGISYYF